MSKNLLIFIESIFIIAVGIFIIEWSFKKNTADDGLSPKISLDILFSHHVLDTDLPLSLLKNRIRQSDIFLMEYPAWDAEFEKDLNDISMGKLSPHEFFSKRQIYEEEVKNTFQFLNLELNALYESGVFVTSVDLPAGDPLGNKINEYIPIMNQDQLYTVFDETLRSQREKYEYWTGLQRQRQQYMVDRFIEITNDIKNKKISAVKDKSEIKIFCVLGSNHVRVYNLLEDRGINVSKEYSHIPYTYDFPGETTIKFINKENVSDELLANGLFQTELLKEFGSSWVHDEEKSTRLIRQFASRFTFDEIKKIFTAMANSKNPELTFEQMVTVLVKQKNLVIPNTKQEFEDLDI